MLRDWMRRDFLAEWSRWLRSFAVFGEEEDRRVAAQTKVEDKRKAG
jgi:hypothetical protein